MSYTLAFLLYLHKEKLKFHQNRVFKVEIDLKIPTVFISWFYYIQLYLMSKNTNNVQIKTDPNYLKDFNGKGFTMSVFTMMKWDKVFENGPSKICRRQPLKNLKWFKFLECCLPQVLLDPFLNTLSQMLLDKNTFIWVLWEIS